MNVQVCWIETSTSAARLRRALRSIPLAHSPEIRRSRFFICNFKSANMSFLQYFHEAQVNGCAMRVSLKVSTKCSSDYLNILSARHKLKVASVHPGT